MAGPARWTAVKRLRRDPRAGCRMLLHGPACCLSTRDERGQGLEETGGFERELTPRGVDRLHFRFPC